MPKEIVQHYKDDRVHAARPGKSGEHPASDGYFYGKNLAVTWNRLGWVQLQVGQAHYTQTQSNPDAFEIDSEEVVAVSEELSREEINKLIRTLRRARDAAYGADA